MINTGLGQIVYRMTKLPVAEVVKVQAILHKN